MSCVFEWATMATVYALIVVDTDGALASGSAIDNSYLVDNNGYLGSWNEGTPSLNTVLQDGQVVNWSVTPVSPEGQVSIAGFSGQMVSASICTPRPQQGNPQVWSGRVESHGQFASFPYTIALSVGGKSMTLNSSIKVV
jgi:hypothetical protein